MTDPDAHLDTETLERALHGELAPERAGAIRAHLDGCADCRSRLDAAAREEAGIFDLLETLDHAPPAARPIPAEVVPLGAHRRRTSAVPRLAAAALALLVVGAAAWAIPGSPVRDWVDRAFAPEQDAAPDPVPGVASLSSGVSIRPGSSMVVEFSAAQGEGRARVEVAAGEELEIRVRGALPALDVRTDRIGIGNAGSESSYAIRIPASAPRVELRVAGRTILVAERGRVRAAVGPDASGAWDLPLTVP